MIGERVESFAEIEAEFIARVHSIVWCTVATIDTRDRPRSRLLHPFWEGATGWVLTWQNTLKSRHLAHNPYVSLTYVGQNIMHPTYVDCQAAWEEDPAEKQRIWKVFEATPEPLGYNPTLIFERADHPNLGLLKFAPWRIEICTFPNASRIWQREPTAGQ